MVPHIIETVPHVIEMVPHIIEMVPLIIETVPHIIEMVPHIICRYDEADKTMKLFVIDYLPANPAIATIFVRAKKLPNN